MTEYQYSSIIWLSKVNKYTIVDNEDAETLRKWKWHYTKGYASRTLRIHREIAKTPSHLMTDHINNNRLDNRKANLRNCTSSQNCQNKIRKTKRASKYQGVTPAATKNKWKAAIGFKRKRLHLGTFNTQEEAANAYNKAAKELFQEFLYKPCL